MRRFLRLRHRTSSTIGLIEVSSFFVLMSSTGCAGRDPGGVWLMDHEFMERELRLEPIGNRQYRASLGCKGPDHLGQAIWDGSDALVLSFEANEPHFHFKCTMGRSGRDALCTGDVDGAASKTAIRRK
jgi:hypothetical protein